MNFTKEDFSPVFLANGRTPEHVGWYAATAGDRLSNLATIHFFYWWSGKDWRMDVNGGRPLCPVILWFGLKEQAK